MIIARPEGNNLPRYVLISFYTASAKNIKLHLVNVALFSHMAIENRKLKLNISKKSLPENHAWFLYCHFGTQLILLYLFYVGVIQFQRLASLNIFK